MSMHWHFAHYKAIKSPRNVTRTDEIYIEKDNEILKTKFSNFVREIKEAEYDVERIIRDHVKDFKPDMDWQIESWFPDVDNDTEKVISCKIGIDLYKNYYPSWYLSTKETKLFKNVRFKISGEELDKYLIYVKKHVLNVQILFEDFVSAPTMTEQFSNRCNGFNIDDEYYIFDNHELKLLCKCFTKKKYKKYSHCSCFYIKDAIEEILNNGGLKENEFVKLYYA